MVSPPKIAKTLLRHMLLKQERDTVIGDFDEFFREIRSDKGSLYARLWYWGQLFRSIPSIIIHFLSWRLTMLNSYLKISMRYIKNQKAYSMINIFGLSVGLASFLLILLYVRYELSCDKYHEHGDRIYRIASEDRARVYMNSHHWAQAHQPVGLIAMEEFPEVLAVTQFNRVNNARLTIRNNPFLEDNLYYMDAHIFDIFSF